MGKNIFNFVIRNPFWEGIYMRDRSVCAAALAKKIPREIIRRVHSTSAIDTSVYAYAACGRVRRRRAPERHGVVITFAIRPTVSYRRFLFEPNIFPRRKLRITRVSRWSTLLLIMARREREKKRNVREIAYYLPQLRRNWIKIRIDE